MEGYGAAGLAPVVKPNIRNVEIRSVRQLGVKPGKGASFAGGYCMLYGSGAGLGGPIDKAGLLFFKSLDASLGYRQKPEKNAETIKEADTPN